MGIQTVTITTSIVSASSIVIQDSCVVTVVQPATSITLDSVPTTINVGQNLTISASVSPVDATDKTVTWSSQPTGILTLAPNDNSVTVAGALSGTATLTATANDGSEVYTAIQITVVQPVSGITVNPSETSISVGQTATLAATVTPGNASNKNITWSSSNTAIVEVTGTGLNAVATAITVGSAVVTATTVDGSYRAICTGTVTKPVTGISINSAPGTIYIGDNFNLGVTVTPNDATTRMLPGLLIQKILFYCCRMETSVELLEHQAATP